jgi:hypothetical protein
MQILSTDKFAPLRFKILARLPICGRVDASPAQVLHRPPRADVLLLFEITSGTFWLAIFVSGSFVDHPFSVAGYPRAVTRGNAPFNLLRQVVYEGLREDKPAPEVRRDVPPHPSAARKR